MLAMNGLSCPHTESSGPRWSGGSMGNPLHWDVLGHALRLPDSDRVLAGRVWVWKLGRDRAYDDAEKAKNSEKIHPGKGKMRNRRYVSKKGPLVVYGTEGSKRVKSKKEKLDKKRKPVSKGEATKIKAAGKAWYNTMISDNDYTEFDNFTKWLDVSQ
ncbi:hypothetical protein ACHQM5_019040 [Ranunculus cassubicifolius]